MIKKSSRIVPDDCRRAAVSALWSTIGAVPGCHIEHVPWDRQAEQPYHDIDMCYLREGEWRRDQVLILHHFGWSPSFHRSHHEIGLAMPDTDDPEEFAARMVADIAQNLEKQRNLARKAHRAGIVLPLDHNIIEHVALDVMHLMGVNNCDLDEEISDLRRIILDLVTECTRAENSDYNTMQGDGVEIKEPPDDIGEDGCEDPVFSPLTSFVEPDDGRRNYLKAMTGSTIVLGNADAIPETAIEQMKGSPLSVLLRSFLPLGERIIADIEHKEIEGSHEMHIHLEPDLWNVSELNDFAALRDDIYAFTGSDESTNATG